MAIEPALVTSSPVAPSPYPPIGDYALLSDCHSAALVSRSASIDWCCMPRIDSPSVFGRILDWERGGHCSVEPEGAITGGTRTYLDHTMVLETRLPVPGATLVVRDCLTMTEGGAQNPNHQLIRVLQALDGPVTVTVRVSPRFDYGGVAPWWRDHDHGRCSAVGGSEGLIIWSDLGLAIEDHHDLVARVTLQSGETRRLSLRFCEPELLDEQPPPDGIDANTVDARLEETVQWWREWCNRRDRDAADGDRLDPPLLRSALVLKSLVTANTGAIVAAPTTSLPEEIGGERNWDYRYSWIRDSWLTVRSLGDLGFVAEADGFRRFVERSAAGSVDEVHLLYGVDGAHRLPEMVLEELEGYRGSSPVRIGNAASVQLQLDMYGYLVELAWQWTKRGHAPDADYAEFIAAIVQRVGELWQQPDHGIWEVRNEPRHFVHSKALCWTALDRGVRLAEMGALRNAGQIDTPHWARVREEIRADVLRRGVSPRRGNFVQAYGSEELDASLLLLPAAGFVAANDPHMVATVDAIIDELDQGGLIRRYRTADGLRGGEGVFVACTFWLVECLVGMGRHQQAAKYFDRACATGNDLGLFAEEFDPTSGLLLGNFPQALSHLAHIGAALALAQPGHVPA